MTSVKGHSHIREARRCRAEVVSARESKFVKRDRARRCHAALLVTLSNTFIVEPYTNKRREAARNMILFLHARVILASESQSLHRKF